MVTVLTVWNGPERSGTVQNDLERSEKVVHGHVTFSAKNERFTVFILHDRSMNVFDRFEIVFKRPGMDSGKLSRSRFKNERSTVLL